MRRIVFLGGIPGSGKTTLGRHLSTRLGIVHVTAGDLIRTAKAGTGHERIRVRDASETRNNQRLLIEGFSRVAAAFSGSILLDGHFVIPSEAGPSEVEPGVFAALGVQALSVLPVDPSESQVRLASRLERARWWDGSVESLEHLQKVEIDAARRVAEATGLRLQVLVDAPEASLERILAPD